MAHLSQLFFDQKLIDAVEQLEPYNTNQIAQTLNVEDAFAGYGATEEYDPFINYIVLGNDLSSGLFAWAELGLNTVRTHTSSIVLNLLTGDSLAELGLESICPIRVHLGRGWRIR